MVIKEIESMKGIDTNSRVIVALDFEREQEALALVDRVNPALCRLKVGKEMFTRFGPQFVRQLIQRNFDVFLDLKFHDIPNTVAKAIAASADLGVWMVNVHASGGPAMLSAAKLALEPFGKEAPLLIAVTVLTSMGPADLAAIGIQTSALEHVSRLAGLTKAAGLDGVVCSAWEAATLKQQCGAEFQLITPGIRLDVAGNHDDQTRIMTPIQAIQSGSDFLVIGRPITQAADPLAVLQTIDQQLKTLSID